MFETISYGKRLCPFHKKCPSFEGRERSGEEIEIAETNLLRQKLAHAQPRLMKSDA